MDWEEEDIREEKEQERKEQDEKEDNFSVCCVLRLECRLEEEDRKHQMLEDQKNKDRKTPQTGPNSSSVDTFTHRSS